jgi:hypothetical protein
MKLKPTRCTGTHQKESVAIVNKGRIELLVCVRCGKEFKKVVK